MVFRLFIRRFFVICIFILFVYLFNTYTNHLSPTSLNSILTIIKVIPSSFVLNSFCKKYRMAEPLNAPAEENTNLLNILNPYMQFIPFSTHPSKKPPTNNGKWFSLLLNRCCNSFFFIYFHNPPKFIFYFSFLDTC